MTTQKSKKKSKFNVLVSRISYASRNIEVEAANAKEAKELALEKAGDFEYSEHDADYNVDGVTPKSKLNK